MGCSQLTVLGNQTYSPLSDSRHNRRANQSLIGTLQPVRKLKSSAFALIATLLTTWSALPAAAITQRDDGDEPGTLMSAGDAALIFIGIPLATFIVLVALIWVPSRGRSKSTEISNY